MCGAYSMIGGGESSAEHSCETMRGKVTTWTNCRSREHVIDVSFFFLSCGAAVPSEPGPPHSRGFFTTKRRTTVVRTLLDGWSARRRNLYLTTHNTHNRQTSMPLVGFETTISADERPLDLSLLSRGHWDRQYWYTCWKKDSNVFRI